VNRLLARDSIMQSSLESQVSGF